MHMQAVYMCTNQWKCIHVTHTHTHTENKVKTETESVEIIEQILSACSHTCTLEKKNNLGT